MCLLERPSSFGAVLSPAVRLSRFSIAYWCFLSVRLLIGHWTISPVGVDHFAFESSPLFLWIASPFSFGFS